MSHHGLKLAFRKRFANLLADQHINERQLNKWLFQKYHVYDNFRERILQIKLMMVTDMVQGNRFSTVPKNNLKDRPICIEPLANILTQRRIGLGIRTCLMQIGVDLNFTAEIHRKLISCDKFATIDLKDASDRISLQLCKYLLPTRLFKLIEQSRSEMTLGPDDNFYLINKVSSMGNGFTFELMSLILLALCKSYSNGTIEEILRTTGECSVFGDDIIIERRNADSLIGDLTNGGLIVNIEKTHINDGYRESCGAHYFDGEGYIKSYDFKWPSNMSDIVVILNKLNDLSDTYPSFRSLFVRVCESVPGTLYPSSPLISIRGDWKQFVGPSDSVYVDRFCFPTVWYINTGGLKMKPHIKRKLQVFGQNLQLNVRGASMHYGFEWRDRTKPPTRVRAGRDWAKILMYIASGRISNDCRRGDGAFKSFLVITLQNGQTFRLSDIVVAIST